MMLLFSSKKKMKLCQNFAGSDRRVQQMALVLVMIIMYTFMANQTWIQLQLHRVYAALFQITSHHWTAESPVAYTALRKSTYKFSHCHRKLQEFNADYYTETFHSSWNNSCKFLPYTRALTITVQTSGNPNSCVQQPWVVLRQMLSIKEQADTRSFPQYDDIQPDPTSGRNDSPRISFNGSTNSGVPETLHIILLPRGRKG